MSVWLKSDFQVTIIIILRWYVTSMYKNCSHMMYHIFEITADNNNQTKLRTKLYKFKISEFSN